MFPEEQSRKVFILSMFNPILFLKEKKKKVHQFFLTRLYRKQALGEMERWTVSDHMMQTQILTSLCDQILTPPHPPKKAHATSPKDGQHKKKKAVRISLASIDLSLVVYVTESDFKNMKYLTKYHLETSTNKFLCQISYYRF